MRTVYYLIENKKGKYKVYTKSVFRDIYGNAYIKKTRKYKKIGKMIGYSEYPFKFKYKNFLNFCYREVIKNGSEYFGTYTVSTIRDYDEVVHNNLRKLLRKYCSTILLCTCLDYKE